MNWITKYSILLLLIAAVLGDHYGERQRNRRRVLKNSQQRHLTYVSHPTTASLRYSEQLNTKKVFRAVLFYTFDDKTNKNGIEKYELDPEAFEKLILSKEFVKKSENPQSTSSLISFFDGKCDISINCKRECEITTDLCPCGTTTPFSTVSSTTPITSISKTTTTVTKTTTSDPNTPKTTTSDPNTPKTTTSIPDTPKTTTSYPDTLKTTTSIPDTPKTTTPIPDTPKTTTSDPGTPKTTTSIPDTPKTTTSDPDTPKTTTSIPDTPKTTTSKTTISTTTTKPTTVSKTYIPPPGSSRKPYTRWAGSYRQYTGQFSFGYTWKPFTGGISWRSRRYSSVPVTDPGRYRQRSLVHELNPVANEI